MNDQPFSRYGYSSFISYATDDDEAWNSWISCFTDELNFSLPARLRGIRLPPSHLSGDNPLVQGRLSEQLCENVKASFAMFLFVHDNYLLSEWCLQELEYFKSHFGENGFRERIYLIAMSERAIEELMKREQWRLLCPFEDLVWLKFYRDDETEWPIDIYLGNSRKRTVVSNSFWNLFVKVREDLAKKIRKESDKERPPPAYPPVVHAPTVLAPTVLDDQAVRVYIESNSDQVTYLESLGQQLESSWARVFSLLKVEPPLYLRPTGLPMNEIYHRPMLDDADGVVLQWGRKTPESLAAQIQKVEPKLSGPNFAPGMIAYLKEGANDQPHSRSVGNWEVVCFEVGNGGSVRVMPEDAPALEAFLSSVLEHKRRR